MTSILLDPAEFASLVLLLPKDWETHRFTQSAIGLVLADKRCIDLFRAFEPDMPIEDRCGILESISLRIFEMFILGDGTKSLYKRRKNQPAKRKFDSDDDSKDTSTSTKRPRIATSPSTTPSTTVASVPQSYAVQRPAWKTFFEPYDDWAWSFVVSHRIYATVDDDEVKFNFVDHSLVLGGTPISISSHRPLFIACMLYYHRLPDLDRVVNGIVPHMAPRAQIRLYEESANSLNGSSIKLRRKDGTPIYLQMLETIVAPESQYGTTTRVVHATSVSWPGKKLALKFSWRYPSASGVSADVYIAAARAKALQMGEEGRWILDRLPEVYHTQTLTNGEEEVQKRLEAFFDGKDGRQEYHRRHLHVVVEELLFPLGHLSSAQDLAQVFVDTLECHKWIYEHARIVHREIKPNNIMYRIDSEDRVIGVLHDFNQAVFLDDLRKGTHLPRHLRGIGNLLSMSLEQAQETKRLFYRHELEAFYFSLLYLATNCKVSPEEGLRWHGDDPLGEIWGEWDPTANGQTKLGVFLDTKWYQSNFRLDQSMKVLRPWLDGIYDMFHRGYVVRERNVGDAETRRAWMRLMDEARVDDEEMVAIYACNLRWMGQPPEKVDEATFGGIVTFEEFMKPLSGMEGISRSM